MFDIDKIAALSKLRIEDAQKELLTLQMQQMVEFVSHLDGMEVECENTSMVEHIREDRIVPSMKREELFANAPQMMEEYIFVPQVVGEKQNES